MARILLQFVLPVLLPAIVYLAWVAFERRRAARLGVATLRLKDTPWLWLAAAGVLLAASIAVAFALFNDQGIEGRYVPPQAIDGRIVPGHIEPPPPK